MPSGYEPSPSPVKDVETMQSPSLGEDQTEFRAADFTSEKNFGGSIVNQIGLEDNLIKP